jgi:hypothetical protein
MRRTGHHINSFVEWVLELLARDEAEHVCGIVHDCCADVTCGIVRFFDRVWEEKQARPKEYNFGLLFINRRDHRICVDIHLFVIEGMFDDPQVTNTRTGLRPVAYVTTVRGVKCH